MNDETATLNTTGTQTKIGRSDNTYELIWDGTAIEGNYTIEEEIGVLEVMPESPGPDDPTKPEDPDKPGKHDSHKNVNKTDNVNESQTSRRRQQHASLRRNRSGISSSSTDRTVCKKTQRGK